jgi:hypothetical protein
MSDNVKPMPGVVLPAQVEARAQQEKDQLVKLVEELLELCKSGSVTWVAMAGEFDNGQKMSAFGNIHKGDALRVVGAIEWLKGEYMAAFSQPPLAVTPR